MKLYEFFTILTEAPVGREYQHLEDLVFVDGSAGALKAADILDNLGKDSSDVTIKWDGRMAVYWGREPDGTFVLVGNNGWGKRMSTSADDIRDYIQNAGRGEEWREKAGNDMGVVFSLMEQATPQDFRGYYFGDLMFHPGQPPSVSKDVVEFTPNYVKYTVKIDGNNIGARMANAKICIAAHLYHKTFGDKSGSPVEDVSQFNTRDVVVLGPTYINHQPQVQTGVTDDVRKYVQKFGKAIDEFLAPRQGLSDMKNIIYTYVNQSSRAKQLGNLDKGFFTWLANSKVSANKQAKIQEMNSEMPEALPAIFSLVMQIMKAKDDIIDQLDSAEGEVVSSTGDERGGEGFVARNSKVKLVPRQRWTPPS